MGQKTTTAWSAVEGSSRLRVLVESADPALALSDFAHFTRAGLDVAVCPGPGDARTQCPLLHDESCPLVAEADVVLFGLGDKGRDLLEHGRRHTHGTPVVVREGDEGAAAGEYSVLPARSSVNGQIDVLRRAALAARRDRARRDPRS